MRPKLRSRAMVESISPPHRITVDEYYDMARTGLIARDARVELIEGEVVRMAPIGDRHCRAVEELCERLQQAVIGRARIRCQMPVRLGDYSEPEPDIVVMRRRTGPHDRAHPSATDVFLIVEISDSSLRYDLDTKVPLYAGYGVPEVWVIDLQNRRLHLYRSPANGCYEHATSTPDCRLTAIPGISGATIDLSEVLGG
ncbi:MAG TPA: Uma2 family endonuclease [Steroidobacteraceae bacterium]|nr:Uma2 family endonuclease [Steroidobacteraceae bacterium]